MMDLGAKDRPRRTRRGLDGKAGLRVDGGAGSNLGGRRRRRARRTRRPRRLRRARPAQRAPQVPDGPWARRSAWRAALGGAVGPDRGHRSLEGTLLALYGFAIAPPGANRLGVSVGRVSKEVILGAHHVPSTACKRTPVAAGSLH